MVSLVLGALVAQRCGGGGVPEPVAGYDERQHREGTDWATLPG